MINPRFQDRVNQRTQIRLHVLSPVKKERQQTSQPEQETNLATEFQRLFQALVSKLDVLSQALRLSQQTSSRLPEQPLFLRVMDQNQQLMDRLMELALVVGTTHTRIADITKRRERLEEQIAQLESLPNNQEQELLAEIQHSNRLALSLERANSEVAFLLDKLRGNK